mgnify:CR=1 FL=1
MKSLNMGSSRKMPADEEKRKRFVDHLSIMIDAIEEKLMYFKLSVKEKDHFKVDF